MVIMEWTFEANNRTLISSRDNARKQSVPSVISTVNKVTVYFILLNKHQAFARQHDVLFEIQISVFISFEYFHMEDESQISLFHLTAYSFKRLTTGECLDRCLPFTEDCV